MKKIIALLNHRDSSNEIEEQAVKILSAIAVQYSHSFEYKRCHVHFDKLSEEDTQTCKASDAILVSNARKGFHLLNQSLPYSTVSFPISIYQPIIHLSPLKTKTLEGLDILLYRDLLSGNNFTSFSLIHNALKRIFEKAAKRRNKFTFIYKNKQSSSAEVWIKNIETIHTQYHQVTLEYLTESEAATQLIIHPKNFDVILVEENLGDTIINMVSGMTGVPAMLYMKAVNDKMAAFGPSFNIPEDIAGKNVANPAGCVLSIAAMLEHFNLQEEATLVRNAINWTLVHGFVTKDIDAINNYSTSTVTDLLCDFISGSIAGFSKGENMQLHKSTLI